MKRIFLIFHFLIFASLWFVASCGVDNISNKNAGSTTNNLNGQCSCDSTYSPVCGNNITYDNSCLASCYGATKTVQGQCVCSQSLVCGSDNRTYTECGAQDAIRKGYIKSIIKFTSCSAK